MSRKVLAQRRGPMLVVYLKLVAGQWHETKLEVLAGVTSLRQTTATYFSAVRMATAASARADVEAEISNGVVLPKALRNAAEDGSR